ncbi:MAG TPA: beta-galactosidase [Actinospica sp.]|nr:beta-galactosidase [Actinospica sp.]
MTDHVRRVRPLAYGADYNPEQWPEEVWAEDARLMREAGVNLVSLGIFAWGLLEPEPGVYDFSLLDKVIPLLADAGVDVDLATPTAAPPNWFLAKYPHVRPVMDDGLVLGGSSRQTYCPHSPEYREACVRIATVLAERYAAHPSVTMWHVHNEYGSPTGACYCEVSAAAFRDWLRAKYRTLDALNEAWTATFWGQTYTAWEQIDTPKRTPMADVNPVHRLDFNRFTSDTTLELYTEQRDVIKAALAAAARPEIPVTTNFQLINCKALDFWTWAREVDVAANNHYLTAEAPDNQIELALTADFSRSMRRGEPWIVMEHSTGAVSWQPRNIAKRPGEMRRNTLSHVARGADGALFFQWRASRGGGEKFHSAMLPHGGTDTRIWREVVELGANLKSLQEIEGTKVASDTAVLWDWESWWALEQTFRPSVDLNFKERQLAYYEQLWRAHVQVDFAHPGSDLSGYKLIVVPQMYLCREQWAKNLRDYVTGGGTLVVSYFSGIVDEDDAVHLGGYPGVLRDLLGLTVGEFLPLRADEHPALDAGEDAHGTIWSEEITLHGAETVHSFTQGPAAGGPAVTRHQVEDGTVWYVSTAPDPATLREILRNAAQDAAVPFDTTTPATLELVHRHSPDGTRYLFAINHADTPVPLPAAGQDLLTSHPHTPQDEVPAGAVKVLRLDA